MKHVMLFLGMTLSIACGGSPEQKVSRESQVITKVETETVRLANVPVPVTAVGTTEPYARATPGTRILGRVASVDVVEGQRVRSGDVLVRIEGGDLSAKRQQALSALREAQAVSTNANAQVLRIRNLFGEKAVSKQTLEETETAFERAKANVVSAEGALMEVDANLGYTAVSSPLDGVVVQKFVEVGDMAAPGAPLFTVEQQDPMKVTVQISERDLPYIQVSQPVVVRVEATRNTQDLAGRVEAVIPSGDPRSRTFEVRVVLDNKEASLRSGMFARVQFQKDTRPGLLISASVVVTQGQLRGVYVIDNGKARLRWVRLGKVFGDRVEVLSGLSVGDQIITSQI
ncbi:MAG: efflux RND transporter periplasmic adaptor subunit, partial [Candidatus Latescibacteria bacterium]|nr:efflux RND transporter periplasmic adaptor subunit [Candidatus Latescibacterota bacterium]